MTIQQAGRLELRRFRRDRLRSERFQSAICIRLFISQLKTQLPLLGVSFKG